MEINDKYFSNSAYAERYDYCERRFSRLLHPDSRTPITFYAGQLSSVLSEKSNGDSLIKKIKDFYDKRKDW